MAKIIILIITICMLSLTQAAYISRMTPMNRLRAPVAFRPGVMLQRPYPQRIVQTATRRAPYIVFRNTPHRYAMKHISPAPVRTVFGPWKATRVPLGSTTPTVFVRAASPSPMIHADGAIHTIPAPNLSLLEKPIVVMDSSDSIQFQEPHKATYEVTEKDSEQPYQLNPKIESPIGFSKTSSPSAADLQNILRQNTALQVASEYTLPVHFSQPAIQLQQPSIAPQQFTLPGFHAIPNQQDLIHRESEQIIIPQNAFYPPDSIYMQKLQTQFVHPLPDGEFVPYTPEQQYQNTQPSDTQNQVVLLQNEQITKQTPSPFISSDGQKKVAQRETQENSFVSIVPKAFTAKNITENLIETDVTASTFENDTINMLPTETQNPTSVKSVSETSTVKSVRETTTESQETTPIFYAQIGQSVGNVVAKGFYSAINDVRAAAEANTDKKEIKSNIENDNNKTTTISSTSTASTTTSTSTASATPTITTTTTTTTTTTPEVPTTQIVTNATIRNESKENKVSKLSKLNLGSPFEKPRSSPSVNIEYTLLRAKDKKPRINKDGEVFAGQLVEAKISEDQEFNKEKATLTRRPVRFIEKNASVSTSKRPAVKAKIPPKSKLTFDDKTGEPVLRVYASYIDTPGQKEIITTKLTNMKRNKDKEGSRKRELNIDWKEDINNLEKSLTDVDLEEQFGLKLRSRSDHHVPIFEDYEEK